MAAVVDKTGYPEDMLELDLDMEADLGIDTVKQVEIFQMITGKYNLELEEGVKLSDYPTIQSVVDSMYDRLEKEGMVSVSASAPAPAPIPAPTIAHESAPTKSQPTVPTTSPS